MSKIDLLTSAAIGKTSLLDALLDSSEDAIITVAFNGTIQTWNKAATEIFGYNADEVCGNNISMILPAEWLSEFIRTETSFGSKTNKKISSTRKRKDGSRFNAAITISSFAQDEDAPVYLLIIKHIPDTKPGKDDDVSAAHLKAIFENAEEGFVLLDKNCIIQALNTKARESIILSYSDTEATEGRCIFDYIEGKRKEFFTQIINQVLAGIPLRYDRSYEQADGSIVWYNFSAKPVREDGEITGICFTGNDITQRKLAEQKVEQNEKRFRGMVENSGDAVSILTIDGNPLYVSPSILKMMGYSEEQAMKMNLFSIIHPDDVKLVKQVWEKIVATPGIPFYGNVCRVLHADGSWRWIDGTITNMIDDPAIGGIVDNFRDITDSIEAERKLRLSEERYKHLFYSNPLPMWIYDPATLNFLEVNHAATEKYGYTREEFLLLNLCDIRCVQEVDRLMEAVKKRKENGTIDRSVWQHLTKTKELLYVEISSHPLQYEGVDAILVIANDVTEKNKAAQLLLKAYEEKANILESITDGFFTVDKNWIVTYWNGEAERIAGVSRENVVSKNIWEVFKSATPLKFYSENQRAMKDKVHVNYEEYFPPLDVWVDVSVYPSDDGLSVFFKDITERKAIQESTRLTKERYDMVAKATNDAIYEWDIIENVNYWGEGYQTLFGHERSDGKMLPETWLENLHPDDKQAMLDRTLQAFANNETSLTREMRFRCGDGSYKTVFDKLVILYDVHKRPLKIVGAMQDITDRKNNELAIEELNKQLNIRAEELVQSNEELERFAYVASHDLQEPLRMVGSFLQLLQKKYQSQLDETANQYIDFAVDGAERMKRLILDLLEYSRVGTNKDLMTNVSVPGIVNTIAKDFTANTAGAATVFHIDQLPEIRGNKMQITQLLQNLVSNAVKYNTSASPEISIGCEEKKTHWQFFVKDNGIGIEAKFLEKVFVIFQRLHNRNQFSGTGIGLAICKKIVERHGGSIWIESVPGKGSTFFFTIKK